MRHLTLSMWITPLASVALAGCLLDTEICGPDFVDDGERCVPRRAPPPFAGGQVDAGEVEQPDGAPRLDMGVGEPDAAVEPENRYAAFDSLLIVDLTPFDLAVEAPFTPGVDVAQVQWLLAEGDGLSLYVPDTLLGWFINNPARQSEFTDPTVLLNGFSGEPVSLGGDSAYVWLRFGELPRPLQAGDQVFIEAYDFDGLDEEYTVLLCPSTAISDENGGNLIPDVTACETLVEQARGVNDFTLAP